MSFAGKVWRLLVGIKDGLALLFLLLFFGALFALLSASPSPGQVRDGALLLDLDGFVVEERSQISPLDALISQQAPVAEYPVHELVHALNEAATDDRITAVVLDLSRFLGGGQVHLQAVSEAIDRVRAADKDVLTFAVVYGDDSLQLAAHASEVWVDPMGGAIVSGPGGSFLFYDELLDKLAINARVYRVGTFKAATEPYTRTTLSDESRENIGGVYGALWEEWQANVKKVRPNMDINLVTQNTSQWIGDAKGDLAQAALSAGLVDKLGDRVAFGERVAEIVGKDDWDKTPGGFIQSDLRPYLADRTPDTSGKPIGIITIAGEIVDGDAGPATAGGDRIAGLLDDALDDDLAALVVRVDSPGGSVTASEEIRRAILRHKKNDIPIAVSMGNIAASGGYWVAMAGDRIFAQPETITGSIGVFAVIPTFEGTAKMIGLNADGLRTTPLSGQPDLIAGFTPEIDQLLQGQTEDIYADFVGLVADKRNISAAQLDNLAQGRVWDGGAARQMQLIDQFGGIEDAIAWAAEEAGLGEGKWHTVRLGEDQSRYDSLVRQIFVSDDATASVNTGVFSMVAQQNQTVSAMMLRDLDRLTSNAGVQAYCIECPGRINPSARAAHSGQLKGWLRAIGQMITK
jgi:protease-4